MCFFVASIFISGCSKQEVEIVKAILKREETIAVYLKDNISDELKESIEQEIRSWEEVKEVKYISKEQALEIFNEQNKEKIVGANPMPASFEITLKSSVKADTVIFRFMDKEGNYIEGIDEVIY